MVRINKAAFALLLIVCLPGCKTIAKHYLPDDIFLQSREGENSYITNDNKIDVSLLGDFEKYSGPSNKNKRNAVISKAISLSDQKCTIHKAQILSNRNTFNVSATSLALLLSGAASVISHAQTASELAAGAAVTTGIQASVNTEVFADALATTILRAIDSVQNKRRAVLESGMDNENYSLSQAIIDIQSYHEGCSMMAGLVEVTKAIDNRLPSRNELQRDIEILENKIKTVDDLGISEKKATEIKEELANRLGVKIQQLANSKNDS